MKKIVLFFFIAVPLLLQAQKEKEIASDSSEDIDYGTVLIKEDGEFIESRINNVDPDALRYLASNYEDAEGIKWVIDESGVAAEFTERNKRINLLFNKKGRLTVTRKYYAEKYLDPLLNRYAKKTAGKDFSIYLVTEIIYENHTIYEISMENKTHWRFVRIVGNKLKGYGKPEIVSTITKL